MTPWNDGDVALMASDVDAQPTSQPALFKVAVCIEFCSPDGEGYETELPFADLGMFDTYKAARLFADDVHELGSSLPVADRVA